MFFFRIPSWDPASPGVISGKIETETESIILYSFTVIFYDGEGNVFIVVSVFVFVCVRGRVRVQDNPRSCGHDFDHIVRVDGLWVYLMTIRF